MDSSVDPWGIQHVGRPRRTMSALGSVALSRDASGAPCAAEGSECSGCLTSTGAALVCAAFVLLRPKQRTKIGISSISISYAVVRAPIRLFIPSEQCSKDAHFQLGEDNHGRVGRPSRRLASPYANVPQITEFPMQHHMNGEIGILVLSVLSKYSVIGVPIQWLIPSERRSNLRRSTITNIVGPPCGSWLFGHTRELLLSPAYGEQEFKWLKMYGPVYLLKGCFGQNRLMISDPQAFQYILNSPHFALSPTLDNMTALVFGEGNLMRMRGKSHKRLRNEFNTAFTPATVRDSIPIFEKVAQGIALQLEASDAPSVNVMPLLCTAALAAIAEDLQRRPHLVSLRVKFSPTRVGAFLPPWMLRAATHLPTQTFKAVRQANHLAQRLGERVVREKEHLAQVGLDINSDLFGMLLNPDRSDTKRNPLSGPEIVAQTQIIMVAGQQRPLRWLFGNSPKIRNSKTMLRTEIHSTLGQGGTGSIVYDRMPFLNALIKETLRFYPAEPLTERMAVQDTVLPLSERITTSTGEQISQIPLSKGQVVVVAMAAYQRIADEVCSSASKCRLESRWGRDANEFRPSRWLDDTVVKGEAVGPYANLWRFAILEMQVILCELVGKFAFALPEDDIDPVRVRLANTLQPTMTDGQKGVPLRVTRIL
ncbi:cytochrome P450 [Mycena olivaceomarginata]|nr:cytochrome P450 [Mycena olivaceomarginata]